MGTPYSVVADKLKNCEAISSPKLVSETILGNGINRKVYTWQLGWDSVSAYSKRYDNKYKYNYYEKGYIKMVFEDYKLVAKEENGLYS